MEKKKLEAKEIEEFGARITIFENGNVYVATHGDVHVIECRWLFSERGQIAK
jgi:hypothetical protein